MNLPRYKIDVEFSLALHDKTGKYFIGRDVCAANRALINRMLFWRVGADQPPRGLVAKLIGRLLAIEIEQRVRSSTFDRLAPRVDSRRPVLHMDPLTILLHRLSARDIVLCHDVGPVTHPQLFHPKVATFYEKAYREIAAAGPSMVFVSVASQTAFHALYKGRFADSRVIYPAIRAEMQGGAQSAPPRVSGSFLLTVGSIGARKNQRCAIEAFARSGLAADGVGYVLCGSREAGADGVVEAASQTPGVVLLDYVTDEELNWLYANAAGFVLPSLLEGFGVPVAEAISRGLVPIVSADSVLHEVAGDGAVLVDPNDPGRIADAMCKLVAMPVAERRRRQAASALALARFSPEAFDRGWREVIQRAAAL
jgi:glycosyltransferase involved in cell wall biosynthesis